MALHGNEEARNRGAEGDAPAVVFASAYEAVAALDAAGPRGVVLVSPSDAAAFPGARVMAAMVAEARQAHPGVPHLAVLDCGVAPGLALDALRRGWRCLVLDPSCPAYATVEAAAAEVGAGLLPARPEALDLSALDLRKEGGRAILTRWLAGLP
ncbi:hypothetical protein ACE7GA_01825 [Roseomonas sp. CCTCC AB2023176]|uniref:hypothetical protein n=1 Tax=Roseomonas sp. CCTCC AB2023176 TaxID=3342640 RepID=UPI0035DAA8F9